ncbi:AAA family ATPase [Micromonospora sp. WMMD980]|uniref:ATP-dependent DNA helicase n=1 Tax=Micromonospora sp. WMMD980 TaxID=3016088 RepID=UPI0024177AFB|nr:AAA family ATPase [Micromonospora sp. WMMD980]MDG4798957.1 AAA family ATPase [Micromonospora sp. WMMD980]MDG4798970.1 AAA family ATPase [Micromonospora sp. WMMD980]MDG4799023.1 AAA family ATPase [Micromonospora sp. WMMD980]
MTDTDLRLADLVGTEQPPPPAPVATGDLDFAPQQEEAIRRITDWYADGDSQVFRLFGYAGTGKTTLARHIVEGLGVSALYAAFTGKAAYVLRSKGCDGASTVHSLIYQPVEKARKRLEGLKAQLRDSDDPGERAELARHIAAEQAKIDSPDWILRDESELSAANLLVLDEVSMVGERMAYDLLTYGTKILCLGDPAQLPPVDGGGYFINAAPDHLLTEIHRSALDSPVTRMATAIRDSQPGQRNYGITGQDGDSGRLDRMSIGELLEFDQVLVGRNATRWQAVHLLRALRGLTGGPQAGDRIIALANSGEAEVFNGQQFDVVDTLDSDRPDRHRLVVRDDEGNQRDLTCWASGFRDLEGEKQAKRDGRGTVVAATFAQAITTHKSQGSQWPRVLVVDESSVFYGAAYREHAKTLGPAAAAIEGHVNGRRWLYTAITRASHRAVIVPSLNGVLS